MADISKVTVGGTTYDIKDANAKRAFYCTCSTAAATAAKVITCADTDFILQTGVIIVVTFTNSNTASNVTFNVNSTGAKGVRVNNAAYTSTSATYCGYASRQTVYMYDGTGWAWIGKSWDNDSTYTFQDTYNKTTNPGATVATVTNAINALDVDKIGSDTEYITSITETDGKISATKKTFPTIPDVSGKLDKSGGTMTGTLTLKANQYYTDNVKGFDAHNSDIIGLNSLYTGDIANNTSEGIRFYRDSTHWDTLTANGGILYFMPNDVLEGTAFTSAKKVAMTSDIPTVNNATLTIQKNGTNVTTFTANASSNATANITVPTKVSELTNDSGYKTTDNNTTYTFAEGTTNGAFSVTPSGGTATSVKVHGVVTDISGKVNKSGDTMTGILNMTPATGEGGEIHLNASTANKTENGIVLDEMEGKFRIFGIPSADAASSSNVDRRVWFSYVDKVNGRPAYDDNFTYRSDMGQITAKRIKATLANKYATRPTNLNLNVKGELNNGVSYQLATSATTTGKPPQDAGVLTFGWDDDSGWGSQLAVGAEQNGGLYYRGANGSNGTSTWENWITVLDTNNSAVVTGSVGTKSASLISAARPKRASRCIITVSPNYYAGNQGNWNGHTAVITGITSNTTVGSTIIMYIGYGQYSGAVTYTLTKGDLGLTINPISSTDYTNNVVYTIQWLP